MEEKLIDLETRIAFLEDAQQQLSDVIARQEKELQHLRARVEDLEEQLRQAVPSLTGGSGDEPPPPHY